MKLSNSVSWAIWFVAISCVSVLTLIFMPRHVPVGWENIAYFLAVWCISPWSGLLAGKLNIPGQCFLIALICAGIAWFLSTCWIEHLGIRIGLTAAGALLTLFLYFTGNQLSEDDPLAGVVLPSVPMIAAVVVTKMTCDSSRWNWFSTGVYFLFIFCFALAMTCVIFGDSSGLTSAETKKETPREPDHSPDLLEVELARIRAEPPFPVADVKPVVYPEVKPMPTDCGGDPTAPQRDPYYSA